MLASLIKLLEERQPAHADPRIIAATVFAASAGLVLTEEYLVDHAGLDVLEREAVRAQIQELMLRLL
jgi:hypothetical protein